MNEYIKIPSRLHYLCGFGWGTIILLVGFILGAVYLTGVLRGVMLTLGGLTLIFMIYQFYKYNGAPWRRVHYRGMLIYSAACGLERYLAKKENRPFDIKNAYFYLANAFINDEVESLALISSLEMLPILSNKMSYYVEEYKKELLPNVSDETIKEIQNELDKIKLCPQLIISKLIERKFGSREVARYALALINRQAH